MKISAWVGPEKEIVDNIVTGKKVNLSPPLDKMKSSVDVFRTKGRVAKGREEKLGYTETIENGLAANKKYKRFLVLSNIGLILLTLKIVLLFVQVKTNLI